MLIINMRGQAKTVGKKLLFLILPALIIFTGCRQTTQSLQAARDYAKLSDDYYQRAVNDYKNLISRSKDTDNLRFLLGRLYYEHGDFKAAAEQFKETKNLQSRKYLAIAYYHLNDFTDALGIFTKDNLTDDESLYYYGLTAEKLNLFDIALANYKKIKEGSFSKPAKERIGSISRETGDVYIKDIDSEVYKIISQSPGQSEYPQAGAIVLLSDEKVEITPQNNQVEEVRYLIKILNDRGKEEFSETQTSYDSTFEKVELEYARTIKPDGTVVEVGTRHIRDVSKYMNFPLYSNVRVQIISFPEITNGSVIEYKLKIYRNQLINKKDFVIPYSVQLPEPILLAKFVLVVPKDRKLHLRFINEEYNNFKAELSPKIEEKDRKLVYRWQFSSIPQIIPESNMPPESEVNPAVIISSFDNWQEIYKWWHGLSSPKIVADELIKNKVKELTQDKISLEDKIKAIHNFCAQNIRYVAVEYGQAGYEPHAAADVFRNKYGDCKDQAVLLVTMLRQIGAKAYPVLIPTKDAYNLNADFPSMLFNHAIAAVELQDKIIFMDPTAQTCSFGDLPRDDQARRVLLIAGQDYKILETPLYPPGHNLVNQELKIQVNADETIKAQKIIMTSGMYEQAQRYWLLYTPPELVQETLKERIQDISIGAKLDNYEVKNLDNLNLPVVFRYTFSGSEYFIAAGRLRIMPQLATLDTSIVAKDKRRFPIDFAILDTKETTFEVAIPKEFVIKYMPEDIKQENAWLNFNATYSYENNKIYFKQKVELKKTRIATEEYAEFKNFFEGLLKKIKQRIILERK